MREYGCRQNGFSDQVSAEENLIGTMELSIAAV